MRPSQLGSPRPRQIPALVTRQGTVRRAPGKPCDAMCRLELSRRRAAAQYRSHRLTEKRPLPGSGDALPRSSAAEAQSRNNRHLVHRPHLSALTRARLRPPAIRTMRHPPDGNPFLATLSGERDDRNAAAASADIAPLKPSCGERADGASARRLRFAVDPGVAPQRRRHRPARDFASPRDYGHVPPRC